MVSSSDSGNADSKGKRMAKWSVCTDEAGNNLYINLDNVLYLARYPGRESTTIMMVGGKKENVQEKPDAVVIAGEDVGQ
jgi:uncharacterized protein YlzI (FlbEa/FlbD family)